MHLTTTEAIDMADKIINSFDVWIMAQGLKSRGRLKSVDNISLEGVARIRELILELAIKGKLISQDPTDEPANTLLAQFAKEKEELIKEGKLRAEKPLPEIKDSEVPFDIPRGWALARLGEITNKIGSGSTPRGGRESYEDEGIVFLRSQNIWNYGIELSDVAFISEETHERMSSTKVLPNDILLNITGGSLGRSTIFPDYLGEANVSQHVTIIRPTKPEIRSFLHLCIISPYGQKLIWGRQVGANREGLSKKVLELFEIPIPPLEEQHRIVAKVGELMALCDELEKQETHHLKSHQLLVETLLGTLTQANDAAEFQTAWSRLAKHFDDLFTTEDSIDQLKQTILQLAVMGKLVPQDPNDEPASELLKRIEREKKRLTKSKKLIQIENSKIQQNEEFLQLPNKWAWCRFGELVRFMAYGTSQKTDDNIENVPVLRMGNITTEGKLVYDNLKYISPDHEDLPDLYLENGDIVFNRTNSFELVGKSGVYNEGPNRYTLASYLIKVSPFLKLTNSDYLNLYINSPLCRATQIEPQITAQTNQANFSGSKLKNIIVPLPPLQEQDRILEKANELLAICDRLKERIGELQKITSELATSVLNFVEEA